MDREDTRKLNKPERRTKLLRAGLIVLALLLISAIPVSAWLAQRRRFAAFAIIDNPVAIYIGSGQKEDMRYININSIDVTKTGHPVYSTGDMKYQDFVFCVYGDALTEYRLQMAHTTNNPFRYELYHAQEDTDASPAASDVKYELHDAAGRPTGTYKYYKISDATPVPGAYKNQVASGDEPILATNALHGQSYGTYSSVEAHAEPLYWQTTGTVSSHVENGVFLNYYILRVYWPKSYMHNTRETDILCIAADSSNSDQAGS